jgi:hypothetical protein
MAFLTWSKRRFYTLFLAALSFWKALIQTRLLARRLTPGEVADMRCDMTSTIPSIVVVVHTPLAVADSLAESCSRSFRTSSVTAISLQVQLVRPKACVGGPTGCALRRAVFERQSVAVTLTGFDTAPSFQHAECACLSSLHGKMKVRAKSGRAVGQPLYSLLPGSTVAL